MPLYSYNVVIDGLTYNHDFVSRNWETAEEFCIENDVELWGEVIEIIDEATGKIDWSSESDDHKRGAN